METSTTQKSPTVLGSSTLHHLPITHANDAMCVADGTCAISSPQEQTSWPAMTPVSARPLNLKPNSQWMAHNLQYPLDWVIKHETQKKWTSGHSICVRSPGSFVQSSQCPRHPFSDTRNKVIFRAGGNALLILDLLKAPEIYPMNNKESPQTIG